MMISRASMPSSHLTCVWERWIDGRWRGADTARETQAGAANPIGIGKAGVAWREAWRCANLAWAPDCQPPSHHLGLAITRPHAGPPPTRQRSSHVP
jgi:hypothetical protein